MHSNERGLEKTQIVVAILFSLNPRPFWDYRGILQIWREASRAAALDSLLLRVLCE